MIMKKLIFILIALIATLTIGAQSLRLENSSFINTCVVQQHIDVGVTLQTNNIYISQTFLPPVTNFYYEIQPNNIYTSNLINNYTSYTEQYRRGVGLNNTYNYIKTTDLINTNVDTQDNYKDVQRYYCGSYYN